MRGICLPVGTVPVKPIIWAMLLVCLVSGCPAGGGGMGRKAKAPETQPVVPGVSGTIAEYGLLVGGEELPVQGYGLVGGLGSNGSREVPAQVQEYFSQLLRKSRALSARIGTGRLPSSVILGDPDTSVVNVLGLIPPGAPAGTRFDVYVSAMAETQTKSLDGGVLLLPAELYLAVPETVTGKRSRVFAEATGAIMVNPFIDQGNPDELPKLREGRIIGGGKVLESRPIRVQLFRGDYQLCHLIQRRINERFGPHRVAVAKDDSTVDISVPPQYAGDYERFMRLVMHLPIRLDARNWEGKAREIIEQMESPSASHDDLSLVLEAIGPQVVPMARTLYGSANPAAAFYAARAGLRLGDADAVDVVVGIARNASSPLRLAAIEELGHHSRAARAVIALRELLDDDSQLVRIAAYESLVRVGDWARVTRTPLSGQFDVDVVDCPGQPVVYVTQSLNERIVLLGKDIPIRRPVFFKAPEETAVISAAGGEDDLTVYRKVPGTSKYTDGFKVAPKIVDLIELLGTLPRQEGREENVFGLGLTYGQVVSVLHKMCKEGDIPAEFRLQALPEVGRIYKSSAPIGRPDMPGQ